MNSAKGLVIIDGLSLLRKVFEANPDPASSEKAAHCCTMALATFRRAVNGIPEFQPTHAAAVFDAEGPNWRHQLYPLYKANRKPMSPYLRAAIPDFMVQLREELGLASLMVAGQEADDVIGKLAHSWAGAGGSAMPGRMVISAVDKDLYHLMGLGAEFRDVFKREWTMRAEVEQKFGVSIEQMPDFLSLMGDSVDGIPGVPKVGPKTAAKLLASYGTLETILEAAAQGAIPGKEGAKLRDYAEMARLSRKLVNLDTNIVLGITWRELRLNP